MFALGSLSSRYYRQLLQRTGRYLAITAALASQMAAHVQAGGGVFPTILRTKHVTPSITTMDQLAAAIDEIDRELYSFGIVSVKGPDIWTQNRMTKYRREYEGEMSKELENFELVLSAMQRRADIAALTTATGIRAAMPSTTSIKKGVQVDVPAFEPPANAAAATVSSLAATTLQVPDELKKPGALFTKTGINLEPTIALDERSRYLYHLQQLSRINAGDDKADLPGYGLYLVRMPISVLPGKKSDRGKGAMVTVEAKHYLTEDLLQTTFRNVLVLDTAYALTSIVLERLYSGECDVECVVEEASATQCRRHGIAGSRARKGSSKNPSLVFTSAVDEHRLIATDDAAAPTPMPTIVTNPQGPRSKDISETGDSAASSIARSAELEAILGEDVICALVHGFETQNESNNIHAADVLTWLSNQLEHAYDFLARDARQFDESSQGASAFCSDIAERIRANALERNWECLFKDRALWLADFQTTPVVGCPQNVFGALTYALVLQSGSVNETLKEDMEIMRLRRNGSSVDTTEMKFYAIRPAALERQTFNDYVAAKWPIHVFSLDPMVDQQNSFDLYSERSSLQMALAVAVATGQVKFDQAISYARQIETDIVTVGLNRTAVGFGAGETTFGWKLFPRVQTPPIASNAHRIGNLLAWGGYPPNYDVKMRRIEPGPRECIALVVMPNFVPSIKFSTTSNWFDLAGHCVGQLMSTQQMLELSRKVQRAKQALVQCVDIGEYRDGEMERLQDRISQIEAMLPMQEHLSNVPNENDLGAAEIFRSNAARLAPVLIAWYGEPVQPKVASHIFVLAKGLSVHETQTIVGGKKVDAEIISRNVLRVPVPANAQTIETIRGPVVDVHIATPNGISNHLYVETLTASTGHAGTACLHLEQDSMNAVYSMTNANRVIKANSAEPEKVSLRWCDPEGIASDLVAITMEFEIRPNVSFQKKIVVPGSPENGYSFDANQLAIDIFPVVLAGLNPASADVPSKIRTTSISVMPVDSQGNPIAPKPFPVTNNLTVAFAGEAVGP